MFLGNTKLIVLNTAKNFDIKYVSCILYYFIHFDFILLSFILKQYMQTENIQPESKGLL